MKPNSTYTLSAWVQGSYVYLGASGTGTTDVSTWTQSPGAWKQLTTTFTTGPSTTSVSVYTHGWYGTPAYYADDVTLIGPGGDPVVIPAVPGSQADRDHVHLRRALLERRLRSERLPRLPGRHEGRHGHRSLRHRDRPDALDRVQLPGHRLQRG